MVQSSSFIFVEDSGLNSDQKRAEDMVHQYWQAGFTTPEKKLSMLQKGDYKNIVIHNDEQNFKFEAMMIMKSLGLQGLFFARNLQSGSMQGLFSYMEKQLELIDKDVILEYILANSIWKANTRLDWSFIDCLLAKTEDIGEDEEVGANHYLEVEMVYDDLQHKSLLKSLCAMVKSASQQEQRAKAITLIFRNGLLRACPM